MSRLLICLVWIVASLAWVPVCSASSSEEERWEKYFGPVTEDERQLYPDNKWKEVRRQLFKEIRGSKRKAIDRVQAENPNWYAEEVGLALKFLSTLENIKPPPPFEGEPNLADPGEIKRIAADEAGATLLRQVVDAYLNTEQYRERATAWQVGGHPPEFRNHRVIRTEYWFNRQLGLRTWAEFNRRNGHTVVNTWLEDGCIREHNRHGTFNQVLRVSFREDCESGSELGIEKMLGLWREDGTTVHGWLNDELPVAPRMLFGGVAVPRTLSERICRRVDTPLMLHCVQDFKGDLGQRVGYQSRTWLIEPGTMRILMERKFIERNPGEGSSTIVKYERITEEIAVDRASLVFSPEESLKSLNEHEVARGKSETEEQVDAERKLRLAGKLCLSNDSDKKISKLRAGYSIVCSMALSSPFGAKNRYRSMIRRCDPQLTEYIVYNYADGDVDNKTGKRWSELEQICEKKFTPPVVDEPPFLFAPCPDWSKPCEDQWQ